MHVCVYVFMCACVGGGGGGGGGLQELVEQTRHGGFCVYLY